MAARLLALFGAARQGETGCQIGCEIRISAAPRGAMADAARGIAQDITQDLAIISATPSTIRLINQEGKA
jgi:hypothetical protein